MEPAPAGLGLAHGIAHASDREAVDAALTVDLESLKSEVGPAGFNVVAINELRRRENEIEFHDDRNLAHFATISCRFERDNQRFF